MLPGERVTTRRFLTTPYAVRSASALHAAPRHGPGRQPRALGSGVQRQPERHQPAHQSTDETSAPWPSTGCKTNSSPPTSPASIAAHVDPLVHRDAELVQRGLLARGRWFRFPTETGLPDRVEDEGMDKDVSLLARLEVNVREAQFDDGTVLSVEELQACINVDLLEYVVPRGTGCGCTHRARSARVQRNQRPRARSLPRGCCVTVQAILQWWSGPRGLVQHEEPCRAHAGVVAGHRGQ